MFVLHYLAVVARTAWTTWTNGVVLVLAVGPAVLVLLYRLFPDAPPNLDDPLFAAAVVWAVLLLLVIIPARIWQAQQARLGELEARPQNELPGMFSGATFLHSSVTLYLTGGERQVTSVGSNTVVRTADYDLVAFQSGSVTVTPEPVRLTLTTFAPAVRVEPAPSPEEPRSPRTPRGRPTAPRPSQESEDTE